MAGIFKAYDIRGIYGTELTDEIAFKIGRAVATFLKPKTFVIGHDMRPHSTPVFEAMAKGLTMQGVDVINIGLASTPMSYYANGKLGADGSVIITASHNPGEWNGMKICRELAIPISGATGIADIERIVNEESFDEPAATPGTISEYDIKPEYFEHIRSFAEIKEPIDVLIDYANGMGILEGGVFTDAMFNITPTNSTEPSRTTKRTRSLSKPSTRSPPNSKRATTLSESPSTAMPTARGSSMKTATTSPWT